MDGIRITCLLVGLSLLVALNGCSVFISTPNVTRFQIQGVDDQLREYVVKLDDPVEEGLYLARFQLEVVERGGAAVSTMRRTYWRRSESGALTIIAEDSG